MKLYSPSIFLEKYKKNLCLGQHHEHRAGYSGDAPLDAAPSRHHGHTSRLPLPNYSQFLAIRDRKGKSAITATLLDFLCRIIHNFWPSETEKVSQPSRPHF
jgi:hypothetical protein